MGACFPKTLTCGEVNLSIKFFNVCCGGKVIIDNSQLDGKDDNEGYYTRRKNETAPALDVL